MSEKCLVCAQEELTELLNYTAGKVVSSDNKIVNQKFQLLRCDSCSHIQKKIDKSLLKTIENIYHEYSAYYLTDGKEEEKFDASNRSKSIVNNISQMVSNKGNILDIGTGTGVFLEEFSKVYDWDLYAQDIKISLNNHLDELKNFKFFFLFNKNELYSNYFDIVSAIHVFEHIIDLNKFLIEMKTALKKDGILLLQVPNIDENIFDVFTIDHVSHFTRKSIYQILKRHFAFVSFTKNQIYREITVIASNKEIPLDNSEFFNTKDVNKKVFSDLLDGLRFKNKIAIFGASPSALFCATYLDFNIECFLDENKNKVGKKLFDKKIIHPLELEPNIEVLVPYSKKLYLQVSDRYPNLKFIYLKSEL